jgi:hypothetical protein
VDLKPGEVRDVELPDGSVITLKKIAQDHDPTNAMEALKLIADAKAKGILLTGLLYANPKANRPFTERNKLVDKPLSFMTEEECRMSKEDFEKIQNRLR